MPTALAEWLAFIAILAGIWVTLRLLKRIAHEDWYT